MPPILSHPIIRLCLCFALGALSSLAMAPANFWPALFIGLSGFYLLLSHAARPRSAFLMGYVFAYGYFVFGLSWIGNALLVDDSPYRWAYPLAVLGIPLGLNIWFALACALSKAWFNLRNWRGLLGFSALVGISEWIRGAVILGGFPWNGFGYTWADILPMTQMIWFDTVYILHLLTILWASATGFLLVTENKRIPIAALILLSIAGCYAYGAERLQGYEAEFHDDIAFKIVQPNIPQNEKWDPLKFDENLSRHIRLSQPDENNESAITFLLWPETSLNFRYTSDDLSMYLIKKTLSDYKGDAYLISGFLRYYPEERLAYNSVALLDENGQMMEIYDKTRLVPFGEYIPFQRFIPLRPITNFSGFERGQGDGILPLANGLNFAPLICYESIFPVFPQMHKTKERADVLINVANDAWYGESAGPYQHFIQGRFRAIEQGLPFIRATSTGISAIVGPMGNTIAQTDLFESDVIRTKIPVRLNQGDNETPLKGWIFFIISGLFLALTKWPQKA